MSLLISKGKLGYIIPRFLKFNLDSELVRNYLLKYHIENLTEVGMPFDEANTECIVIILENKSENKLLSNIFEYLPGESKEVFIKTLEQDYFKKMPSSIFNTIVETKEFELIEKMQKISIPLKDISDMKRGMEIGKTTIRENKSGLKILLGEEVNKYTIGYRDTFVEENNKEVKRLNEISVKNKVLIRRVANKLIATYDNEKYYFIKNLYGLVSTQINLIYVLGILNSKLLNFFFKKYFTSKKEEIFPEIQSYQINSLPIKVIDINNSGEVIIQNKLISLVDQMLSSKKQLSISKTENEKTYWERKCNSIDNQIDRLVYELYGLTEKEISVVEGKSNPP